MSARRLNRGTARLHASRMAARRMIRDYSITVQDASGRTLTLGIDGVSINAEIRRGASESAAVEEAEQNAVGAAIHNGAIGADCWIVAIDRGVRS